MKICRLAAFLLNLSTSEDNGVCFTLTILTSSIILGMRKLLHLKQKLCRRTYEDRRSIRVIKMSYTNLLKTYWEEMVYIFSLIIYFKELTDCKMQFYFASTDNSQTLSYYSFRYTFFSHDSRSNIYFGVNVCRCNSL